MSQANIVCKPTGDTFVRFGIVIAALVGFALYFFYDGHTGYRQKNEVMCSFKAFAQMGQRAAEYTAEGWASSLQGKPLIVTEQQEGELMAVDGDHRYPLPADCEAARSCPPEVLDHAAMSASWNDCWAAYSHRMHFPIKPGEHPYDLGAIREQWIAGVLFLMLGGVLIYFVVRTSGRVLALEGSQITAAGRTFDVADIERIDLRQWGPGFKGVAYFTVKGAKVRVDGMTYGGFNKDKGEPAEMFMQAVLNQYKGDIVEYEIPEKGDSVG
ncbi:MAG: hypothetical protein IKZ13_00290 [Akkermansia sp.]|nr:hypothetical protein [Akkermansia sp.]